ncbi:MAG: hypothetical protein NZM09_12105 [Ignavibacterium sp.]|nr:hypothetical protein [Ignavibacterium sp.]MDW8376418.1 hypothetical protein [Ignavibacteriales bacterium]
MQDVEQLRKDVTEIDKKLELLLQQIAELKNAYTKLLDDHENRIRFLERYAFALIGIMGLLSLILSYFK